MRFLFFGNRSSFFARRLQATQQRPRFEVYVSHGVEETTGHTVKSQMRLQDIRNKGDFFVSQQAWGNIQKTTPPRSPLKGDWDPIHTHLI